MTTITMPAAPACPTWCTEQHNDHTNGWDVSPGSTEKRCAIECKPTLDRDGEPVLLILERYSFLDDGEVTTEETEFRIAAASLTVEQAERLADAIQTLAARLSESETGYPAICRYTGATRDAVQHAIASGELAAEPGPCISRRVLNLWMRSRAGADLFARSDNGEPGRCRF